MRAQNLFRPSRFVAAVRAWRAIEWDERGTFLQTLVLVPSIHVAVRIVGFNRLQTWVSKTAPRADHTNIPAAEAVRRAVVSLHRVKHYSPLRGNCLSQSLALSWALRRRGIEPVLRLGVRLADSTFAAHAWIEWDGHVLNDTQDVHTRYSPLVARTRT